MGEYQSAAALGYRETIAAIGAPVPLYGVLCEPVQKATDTALLILNSGLLHQVGACNASVILARAAAARGYQTLRFDASGIGDSPVRSTADSHETRAVAEALEAVSWLSEQRGTQRFVAMGLCSGAFASFNAALEEPRIHGLVQIAGFAYPNARWTLRHYGRRLHSPRAWNNRVSRWLGRSVEWRHHLPSDYLETDTSAGWSIPAQETLAAGYAALTKRDVAMLSIMTGGEAYQYNYEGQLRDNFPVLKGARFEEHLFAEASHILTERQSQLAVRALILNWLERQFPA